VNERLTPIEAIMWRAGQDPNLRMTVGALVLLDRPVDRDALVERLDKAGAELPRLRVVPDDPSHTQLRPWWTEAEEFNAADHVRALSIASPGDRRQLLDMVAMLELRPFDPGRSPWDVTLIDGVDGSRAALYMRAHHALADGIGGRSLMSVLFDQPDAPVKRASARAKPAAATTEEPEAARRQPGTINFTIDLTKAAGAARTATSALRSIDPYHTMVRALQGGLDTASSVSRQVVVGEGSLSSLPVTRSMHNRFEIVSVPGARHMAIALGGSRHDLLIAATAAALGAYEQKLGLEANELRVAMPALTNRGDERTDLNWFAPLRVVLPSVADHPGPYFGVVSERLARARHEPALRVTTPIASALSRLPNRLLLPALQTQARAVDFAATCLPGVRNASAILGSEVQEMYPFGPRLGCLMNVTGFGVGDRLDVGVTIDSVAIADPDLLLGCITDAFASFASSLDDGVAAAPVTETS
jgi:diacylglycerol O-acyltransferase / wax synthase